MIQSEAGRGKERRGRQSFFLPSVLRTLRLTEEGEPEARELRGGRDPADSVGSRRGDAQAGAHSGWQRAEAEAMRHV
eukprot:2130776-Rhodomonas_salina.1